MFFLYADSHARADEQKKELVRYEQEYEREQNENYKAGRESEDNESFGELGGLTGLGTVGLVFIAACPLLLRQFIIPRLQSSTKARKWAQELWHFLKRWHLVASFSAVCITLLHGFVMIVSGEEAGITAWLGYVTALFMLATIPTGIILKLRKRRSTFNFKTHKFFALSTGLLAAVHIVI